MPRKTICLAGTINGFVILRQIKSSYYLVICPECKSEKQMRVDGMKSNNSCGCLQYVRTHGLDNKNPIYFMWHDMKTRCYDPKSDRFNAYGKRGIVVCEEWRKDYKIFNTWVNTNGWKRGLQIDRIDNNGNYTPENCRIVSKKQNSRNRQNTIWIEIGENKKVCLSEACENLGLGMKEYKSVHYRMHKRGNSFEDAVSKVKLF